MYKSNKIKNFLKYLILSIIPISFITVVKAEIKVVTTIQPLHSLISNVMGSKGKLHLILEGRRNCALISQTYAPKVPDW